MNTLISLGIATLYFAGWFVGTVAGSRWFATHREKCMERRSWGGSCRETHIGGGHWRGDGRVGYRELWTAALPALIWPLALVPVVALAVANSKPTAKAMRTRIADLERELNIGGDA